MEQQLQVMVEHICQLEDENVETKKANQELILPANNMNTDCGPSDGNPNDHITTETNRLLLS